MTRARRRLLATLLALLASALLCTGTATAGSPRAAPPAGSAPHSDRGTYTVFNRPLVGGEHDYRIESDLVQLIEGAPPGSTIYGSMYTWTRTPVAEALSEAQARGVHVRLAIDADGSGGATSDPDNPAQKILRNADLDQLVYCRGPGGSTACVSNRPNSINHNKLFMFSRTRDMTDAVWVASYNLTHPQGRMFNNAVVFYGDAGLYDEFEADMQNMLAQNKTNDYFGTPVGHYRNDDGSVTVFMSPRPDSSGGIDADPSTDEIARILDRIQTYEKGCEIDVAEPFFTGPRRAVADELVRIANLGCDVKIVHGPSMSPYTYNILHGVPGIDMKGYYDGTDPEAVISVHSKYIRIQANVGGEPSNIVLTGSQNLTGPALRMHDEVLVAVRKPAVAKAYLRNFQVLWNRATCVNVPDDVVCHRPVRD